MKKINLELTEQEIYFLASFMGGFLLSKSTSELTTMAKRTFPVFKKYLSKKYKDQLTRELKLIDDNRADILKASMPIKKIHQELSEQLQ